MEEFKKTIDLVLYVFGSLGFADFTAQISLRDPENKKNTSELMKTGRKQKMQCNSSNRKRIEYSN
jgi:threonyl-tRNA synthetase